MSAEITTLGRITEGPILNRLNTVQARAKIKVEVAKTGAPTTEIRSGRLAGFTPNARGPLGIMVSHGGNYEGTIPFAGSSEGIVQISTIRNSEEVLVFDNPRIPKDGYLPPYSTFSGMDEFDDRVVERQVAMGLYDSPETLRAARDAASK